jgi:hypothetical protein
VCVLADIVTAAARQRLNFQIKITSYFEGVCSFLSQNGLHVTERSEAASHSHSANQVCNGFFVCSSSMEKNLGVIQ